MRLPTSTYLSLALLTITASAAVVKEGSTCIVTPTQAASVKKSIVDLTPPSKRDMDDPSSVWEDDDPYAHPAPGSPGALNHFPRPAPSKGSSSVPPTFAVQQQQQHKRSGSDFGGLEGDPDADLLEEGDDNEYDPNHEKRQSSQPDDTPPIVSAFRSCSRNSLIIFQPGVYHIRQVMNTTDLLNVTIHIRGTFLWSANNLSYWTSRSYSVTYVGRSTAWLLGGKDVSMLGFRGSPTSEGSALFDGQGQIWIDQNRNNANRHPALSNQPSNPWTTQTDSYSNCDASRIPITDIRWENMTGTARYNVAAGLHCSAAAPCDNLKFSGIDIKPLKGGNIKTLCSNIKNQVSSGLTCTGPCPGSHPQQIVGECLMVLIVNLIS